MSELWSARQLLERRPCKDAPVSPEAQQNDLPCRHLRKVSGSRLSGERSWDRRTLSPPNLSRSGCSPASDRPEATAAESPRRRPLEQTRRRGRGCKSRQANGKSRRPRAVHPAPNMAAAPATATSERLRDRKRGKG